MRQRAAPIVSRCSVVAAQSIIDQARPVVTGFAKLFLKAVDQGCPTRQPRQLETCRYRSVFNALAMRSTLARASSTVAARASSTPRRR